MLIHSYLKLALLEGEGIGSAYEYCAKHWLYMRAARGRPAPRSILVAGLPGAFGVSANWLLVAERLGARLVVLDEREDALGLFRAVAQQGHANGILSRALDPETLCGQIDSWPAALDGRRFDAVVSSNAIQRLSPAGRAEMLRRAGMASEVLFATSPNPDNRHKTYSAIPGIAADAWPVRAGNLVLQDRGYDDMPPFPSGARKSAEFREKAGVSRCVRAALAVLQMWTLLELLVPRAAAARIAHETFAVYGAAGEVPADARRAESVSGSVVPVGVRPAVSGNRSSL